MYLFGNPNFPKRNLTTGGLLLILSSFKIGMDLERVIWNHGNRVDYIFLGAWALLLLAAIKIFRLGLASVPPDPEK